MDITPNPKTGNKFECALIDMFTFSKAKPKKCEAFREWDAEPGRLARCGTNPTNYCPDHRSLNNPMASLPYYGEQVLTPAPVEERDEKVQAEEFNPQDLMNGFESDTSSRYTPTSISDVYDPGSNPGMPEIGEPGQTAVVTFAVIVSCAIAAVLFSILGLWLRVRGRRRAEARNLALLRANEAGRIHAMLEAEAMIREDERRRINIC